MSNMQYLGIAREDLSFDRITLGWECGCRLGAARKRWTLNTPGDVMDYPKILALHVSQLVCPQCNQVASLSGHDADAIRQQVGASDQPTIIPNTDAENE